MFDNYRSRIVQDLAAEDELLQISPGKLARGYRDVCGAHTEAGQQSCGICGDGARIKKQPPRAFLL